MRRGLLVGAGNMGRNWARTLRASEGAMLAGWVDLRGDVLERAAADLGIDGVVLEPDLGRALETIRTDFVVDVTPARWLRRRSGPGSCTWSARTGATTPPSRRTGA
jgi:hypothetical protein